MAKLPNKLTTPMRMLTIFLFLWGNIIVMVRPEDRDDGVHLRVTGDRDDSSFKVALSIDRHYEENVLTDWKQKQHLKPVNVITTILDIIETPGIQKLTRTHTMRKPRFLCLHSHGSNAAKLKTYLNVWPTSVTENLDLVFINAPFRIYDETDDDEHYEWFTLDKINTGYDNFEEGISYIENLMIELGPFDGVLGFSQGAIVAGALPGMQEQGTCLTKVGKIEHVVLISGAKLDGKAFPQPKLAETAYLYPINIPSLHIFGETDIARPNAPALVEAYVDPLVIYHHGGHEVPKLDENGLKIMFEFLRRINAI